MVICECVWTRGGVRHPLIAEGGALSPLIPRRLPTGRGAWQLNQVYCRSLAFLIVFQTIPFEEEIILKGIVSKPTSRGK